MMEERIKQELELLKLHYASVEYESSARWVLIEPLLVPEGWSEPLVQCAFKVPVGYPGTPPYGFYVPSSLRPDSGTPGNYQAQPSDRPPFPGTWSFFSWGQESGGWLATDSVRSGSNLLNFSQSFRARLREGA